MKPTEGNMKRLLALLAVFVLVAAACGDDEPEPAAGGDEPAAPAVDDEGDTGTAEPADDAEMMLDELNVAYFLEWPTA
ncbi:MAG: hypothetical protein F4144_04340, partial [Acidimicrobiaceae bacterium]|nr:hypothetical protein [Acidimicrobiaceae bacterium]